MARTIGSHRFLIALLVLILVPAVGAAQQNKKKKNKKNQDQTQSQAVKPAELVAAYERGAYQEVVDKVQAASAKDPEALYIEGLSYDGLKSKGNSRRTYQQLAERKEGDPWRYIGESAVAVGAGDLTKALGAADRAVELAAGNKYAHYQRGWVLLNQKNYAAGLESFKRLLEIDGNFAYGHYYAGVCYNQTRNLVAMSHHWERFLELAPEAPERLQVESVLRSIRG